jgi:SanA protein
MCRLRIILQVTVITASLLVIAVFSVPLTVRFAERSYQYESVADVPKAEAVMILGASVAGGEPSPVLADRIDMAIDLFKSGKVKTILVTGDNGENWHDEVTPVRKYLLAAGIPAKVIFLDHAGFDTYSSMYRAKAVFGAHTIIIVTQDFHLPRAVFLARSLGLDAYGIVADQKSVLFYNYLREVPASIKAVWDVLIHRKPKYLGDVISLSGDGQKTWY